MEPADVAPAVEIHRQVLGAEFITRGGPAFLRAYYRAWRQTPGGLALVAVDESDRVVGALLGGLDPVGHYRSMLRGHGWRLGALMARQALRDPAFGRDLVLTRGLRYGRGLMRLGAARLARRRSVPEAGQNRAGAPPSPVPSAGEVTHVLVHPRLQGAGIGRALLGEAVRRAHQGGLSRLSLVTTAELATSGFYDRLGWEAAGELTSRSGETFWRYDHFLGRPRP
jgi:GNAT superfamily N-acetyltransferase